MESRTLAEKINTQLWYMEREINKLGWSRIINTYHPDVNMEFQQAQEIFGIYKKIYDGMVSGTAVEITSSDQVLLYNLYRINF